MKDHFPLFYTPLMLIHYSARIILLLHKQLIVKYMIRYNSRVSRCWKRPTQKPTILQCWQDCYLVFQRDGLLGTLRRMPFPLRESQTSWECLLFLIIWGKKILRSLIRKSVSEYLTIMDLLDANNILGCISIKPSQVGLAINYDLCLRNIYEISKHAT